MSSKVMLKAGDDPVSGELAPYGFHTANARHVELVTAATESVLPTGMALVAP